MGSERRSRVAGIDVVEAAYAMSGSEEQWLTELATQLGQAFDRGLGVVGQIVDVKAQKSSIRTMVQVGDAPPPEEVSGELEQNPDPEFLTGLFLETGLRTLSEVLHQKPEHASYHHRKMGEPFGVRDILALTASDGLGVSAALSVGQPEPRSITPAERRFWGRVAVHVAAGLRLREQLRAIAAESQALHQESPDLTRVTEAVLSPNGRVEHAEDPAKPSSVREKLRDAVKSADRARGRLRRSDPEGALNLWKGMVDGRWSLVDRFESDGRRFVVACKNPLRVQNPRALSARERQVVHLVSLGRSNGEVSYELGLSDTAVATHLGKALRKLGINTRTELRLGKSTCEKAEPLGQASVC